MSFAPCDDVFWRPCCILPMYRANIISRLPASTESGAQIWLTRVQAVLDEVQGQSPWRGVGCPHLFPSSYRRRRHKQLAHGVGYDIYVCASITEICGKRKEIHDKNYQTLILQQSAQKAPVIHPGDEWAFLVWGLGRGVDIGSSHARYASTARRISFALATPSRSARSRRHSNCLSDT